jgi:hypothetical protein
VTDFGLDSPAKTKFFFLFFSFRHCIQEAPAPSQVLMYWVLVALLLRLNWPRFLNLTIHPPIVKAKNACRYT